MQTMNKTWEEAADDAVSEIYDMAIVSTDSTVDSLIKFMRHRFDQTLKGIENYIINDNDFYSIGTFKMKVKYELLFSL